LIAAVDLRGRYREPFSNWEAATDAPHSRLRGDLELLPSIAEAGLSRAAKDISQGGIVGTAAMLAECSGVAIDINLEAVPKPDGVALERWLLTFPSFGYLLSVKPQDVAEVTARFTARGIAAADIGSVAHGSRLTVGDGIASETIWDFTQKPLIGAGLPSPIAVEAVA
jgi:selenophosphate synthetase-related protein